LLLVDEEEEDVDDDDDDDVAPPERLFGGIGNVGVVGLDVAVVREGRELPVLLDLDVFALFFGAGVRFSLSDVRTVVADVLDDAADVRLDIAALSLTLMPVFEDEVSAVLCFFVDAALGVGAVPLAALAWIA